MDYNLFDNVLKKIDEDEAAPAINLCLRQVDVLSLPLREVPADRIILERPVVVPGDAVIGAAEFRLAAVQGDQLAAAMQAGIVERLEFVGTSAHDDEGFADILVDEIVTHVWDFLVASGHLPDARP